MALALSASFSASASQAAGGSPGGPASPAAKSPASFSSRRMVLIALVTVVLLGGVLVWKSGLLVHDVTLPQTLVGVSKMTTDPTERFGAIKDTSDAIDGADSALYGANLPSMVVIAGPPKHAGEFGQALHDFGSAPGYQLTGTSAQQIDGDISYYCYPLTTPVSEGAECHWEGDGISAAVLVFGATQLEAFEKAKLINAEL